jgi:6-phosphofructo-2-kinase/fructose-2,6-biphosphatase 2
MEMARPRKTNGIGIGVEDTQICVVMVGLPARGKSLIAQKGEFFLEIYLITFFPSTGLPDLT